MPSSILLPEFLSKKLDEEPVLKGHVERILSDFAPWLEQSGMPFFPGFTDHSPRHINDVLKTASSLITDESREIVSAKDIAVLILAILLHDCGMHLTPDSFQALIQDESAPMFPSLGDKSWKVIWHDFLGEASRFDDVRLIAIFGNAEPITASL
jgi:molecular chaperone HtpG